LSDELFEKGMAVRRAVLGADYVERAEANKTEFDADWQLYVTEHAWAAVWSRPGLDRRTRSMLTIAMLATLGRLDELGAHIRATRNTGVTQDEVKEVLLQVAVYAGAPAANSAFAVAKRIYKEMESEKK
jgi:4-carboxymuconolactone decarboxylase